jgi:hypothetical protein
MGDEGGNACKGNGVFLASCMLLRMSFRHEKTQVNNRAMALASFAPLPLHCQI